MINELDFSKLKKFPGEEGNTFDIILKGLAKINQIPGWLFLLILGLMAYLFSSFQPIYAGTLLAFFILDWLLLAILPVKRLSFGPTQPVVFLLAIARGFVALLPILAAAPLQILGTFLILYGFFYEPHHIKITYQTLSTSKISGNTPLRILHLGDLHIERITRRELDLQRKIKELKPDLILFSGDILNLSYLRDPVAQQDARKIIQEWAAPLGVYLVSGSPAVDLKDLFPNLVKDLPVHWLQNEKMDLNWHGQIFSIHGITCSHRPQDDIQILEQLQPDADRFNILLYHTPDLAPSAARHPIDLQLSGHTHGGQVRLPLLGALVTGSLYGKALEAGRYRFSDLTLYITRGIGMEGEGAPRVRFLCPPEIILWEICSTTS